MIVFPNAKINLGLFVESKRPDGYHNIQSVFYPIPCCDVLEFVKADSFDLEIQGLVVDSALQDNLVYKAWKLLHDLYAIAPVRVVLLKSIPMGAGLGGGSADAAFFLKALSEFFMLHLSNEELEALAANLGSDCPFFVENRPALVEGRGEKMRPIPIDLKGYYLVLLRHDIHVSTAEAYAQIQLETSHFDLAELRTDTIGEWKNYLFNSFESTVFIRHPKIASLKQALYDQGAIYAAMSGSGSSVFGLFREEVSLKAFKDVSFVRSYEL